MRVEIRRMTCANFAAGIYLSQMAGWNQKEQDWRRFLLFEPDGCLAAVQDGKVCGTVTALENWC